MAMRTRHGWSTTSGGSTCGLRPTPTRRSRHAGSRPRSSRSTRLASASRTTPRKSCNGSGRWRSRLPCSQASVKACQRCRYASSSIGTRSRASGSWSGSRLRRYCSPTRSAGYPPTSGASSRLSTGHARCCASRAGAPRARPSAGCSRSRLATSTSWRRR